MSTPADALDEILKLNKQSREKVAARPDPTIDEILRLNKAPKRGKQETISAETRPYYMGMPEIGDLSSADIAEALPGLGGQIVGMIPHPPGFKAGAASVLGQAAIGGFGEAMHQEIAGMGGVDIRDPKKVGAEAIRQGVVGAIGEGGAKLLTGVANTVRAVGARPMGRAVEKGAAELNLPPRPEGNARWFVENTLAGRRAAKTGAQEGIQKATAEVGEAAETLDVPIPPAELQGLTANEIAKLSKKTRKAGASAFDAEVEAAQAAAKEVRKEAKSGIAALQSSKETLQLRANQEADARVRDAVNMAVAEMSPQEAGRIVKSAIPANHQIARAEANRLYDEIWKSGDGVTVDISDWKARLTDMLKDTEPFEDAKLKRLRTYVFGTETAKPGVYEGGLPPAVDLKTAHELQSMLRDTLPSFKLLFGRSKAPAAALQKELHGTIIETLESKAPVLAPMYDKANKFYRGYADVYDRSVAAKVVKANPEDFIEPKILPPKGLTEAQALRRAIIGDAERYGTPEQKAAAKEAALAWQGTFVRERLMGGGIEDLPKRLKEFNSEVVDTVMGATPEGKVLIDNIRTVAKSVEESGPKIEAHIAAEVDKLKKIIAKPSPMPTPSPEKAAAMQRLQLIEDVIARSEAGVDKQNPWWSIAMGMGGLGYLLGKEVGPALIGGAEVYGGVLAKAMYDPVFAKQFADRVDLAGRSFEVGAPALARLWDTYLKRQKRKDEQERSWRYITPPPALIQPTTAKVTNPFETLPEPPK